MKKRYEIIGWDVDTQRDFMEGAQDNPVFYEGKLKIDEARDIFPALEKLTAYLREMEVPIFGSVDWHPEDAYEFPVNGAEPDFAKTFPKHCVRGTYGAEKIDATRPLDPFWVEHDFKYDLNTLVGKIARHEGEVFFRKDRFDVFDEKGNAYAAPVLKELGVEKAIVYGVALEVCNDFAVKGLQNLGVQVYAVEDAMKAIDEEVRTGVLQKWRDVGAKVIKLEDVLKGRI